MWRNDKPNGMGCKLFSSGDKHEGAYVNDRREGYGVYSWANGDKCRRSHNDTRAVTALPWLVEQLSHLRFLFPFSLIFPLTADEGNWSSGQMHGKGIKTLRNGDRYSGLWSSNQANGFGVKTFNAGDVHEGEYKDDLRHGYGQYRWKSGDRFEGVVSGPYTYARAFL